MKTEDKFKLTEKKLFRYFNNLKLLSRLRDELQQLKSSCDIQAQNYDASHGNSPKYADPVATHVEKILTLENKIVRIERDTLPISCFIMDLEEDGSAKARAFLILFRLFYCDKYSISKIALSMNISRRTLYSRRRALVKSVLKYFK